jgi:hypothetical protein
MPWSRYTNENMALYNSHAVFIGVAGRPPGLQQQMKSCNLLQEHLVEIRKIIIYSVLSQSRKESA